MATRKDKKLIKEIVLKKCEERESAGFEELHDSDIMDILDECERNNIKVTRKDLHVLGFE